MDNPLGNGKFELEVDGVKMVVAEHTVQDQQIYRLTFDDNRPALIITKAATWQGNLWASAPQGRQEEAEKFGNFISDYLKQK